MTATMNRKKTQVTTQWIVMATRTVRGEIISDCGKRGPDEVLDVYYADYGHKLIFDTADGRVMVFDDEKKAKACAEFLKGEEFIGSNSIDKGSIKVSAYK